MNDDVDIDIIKLIDKEIAKLSLTDKYCYALGADLNKLEGEIQSIELYEIEKSEDVYGLLEGAKLRTSTEFYDVIIVITSGWAAPIEDDSLSEDNVPPSKHPGRRRVELHIALDKNSSMACSILFMEEGKVVNTEYDTTGTGPLADAVRSIHPNNLKSDKTLLTKGTDKIVDFKDPF
jgi:hypothetical protein